MIGGLFTEHRVIVLQTFYFISVNIFLNAVFHVMVDHASIPSPLILNGFSENV